MWPVILLEGTLLTSVPESRALLTLGDPVGVLKVVMPTWEQSSPSVVACRTRPPSFGLRQGLNSSAEAPGDGVRGLKSSGLLEGSEGGVWLCLGGG